VIRPATIFDLPFAFRCWRGIWKGYPPLPFTEEEMLATQTALFIDVVSEKRGGVCLLEPGKSFVLMYGELPVLRAVGTYVVPEARKLGLGSALWRAAQGEAKRKGYARIFGSRYVGNDNSEFWTARAGWKELEMTYVRDL